MPCYKCKTTHVSAADTKPGSGANWQTYWEECPCCPPSSSSSGGTTSSSQGATSSSQGTTSSSQGTTSSSQGTTSSSQGGGAGSHAAVFVLGGVPDWNQPAYYQNSGTADTVIPGGAIGNGVNELENTRSSRWAGQSTDAFKAWCAPTAAACQLGHLQHHHAAKLVNTPARINESRDAGIDVNPSLRTISWDSAAGWADWMLDGPTWRGKKASPDSINGCFQTDFGWWMDTNGAGNIGTSNLVGTTLGKIYDGLVKFYSNAGWQNFIGMAYHLPHNGSTLVTVGQQPYSNNSNADLTQVWNAIKSEIDNNRTVVATTMGFELQTLYPNQILAGGTNNSNETKGEYYMLGNSGQTGQIDVSPAIDGGVEENINEQMTWEVYDANGIGHTVLIVGYIPAGSAADVGPAVGVGAVDWVIIRDNLSGTARNVVLPFNNVVGGAWSFWDILLSTCYVNPAIASLTSTCSASGGSSGGGGTSSGTTTTPSPSSSSSSAAGSGGQINYYRAYPCSGTNWNPAYGCNTWYTLLNGGVLIGITDGADTGTLWGCAQDDGSTLYYKISKVTGSTTLGGGAICCLLLKVTTNTSGFENATLVTGSYQDCDECNNA